MNRVTVEAYVAVIRDLKEQLPLSDPKRTLAKRRTHLNSVIDGLQAEVRARGYNALTEPLRKQRVAAR